MLNKEGLISEAHFRASRSSGPGGQNVNKVNTRVELIFHIDSSYILSETEKIKIQQKLENRVNNSGELVLASEKFRAQIKNKEDVIEKFLRIIEKALMPEKKRVKTKPTIASQLKRLKEKKINALKKENRRPPDL